LTDDVDAYVATTGALRVTVRPAFAPEQSNPRQGRWFWTYAVRIENLGEAPVRLVSRHWIITDGVGRVEEVRGPGVVGEQPELGPGESFDYVSGCPLTTPSGTMSGTYQMVFASGEPFEARIPAFSLHLPDAEKRLN
jgi:ApaG protein